MAVRIQVAIQKVHYLAREREREGSTDVQGTADALTIDSIHTETIRSRENRYEYEFFATRTQIFKRRPRRQK